MLFGRSYTKCLCTSESTDIFHGMGTPKQPKGPPGKEETARMVILVPKSFHRDVRIEALQRDMTLGELVQEAFGQRFRITTRDPK